MDNRWESGSLGKRRRPSTGYRSIYLSANCPSITVGTVRNTTARTSTYRSHDGSLPVKLNGWPRLVVLLDMMKSDPWRDILRDWISKGRGHTRSSPIGPAEHDDGGSLLCTC